jgi:hypothetical protein
MFCICCQKDNVLSSNLTNNPNLKEEDILWSDKPADSINQGMVNGGIIQVIEAGFGSTHDGDQLVIAICDDCISNNVNDGTVLYLGSYIFGNMFSDDIEKSKKIFRRRKNLDKLV